MEVLWTIQLLPAYNTMLERGYLASLSEEEYIALYANTSEDLEYESMFIEAYKWMVQQMHRNLPHLEFHDHAFPLWAWHQYENINKRRPDLRNGGLLPKNTKAVLIEFEADISDVLLTDFDGWHFVLNQWYLPLDDADADNMDYKVNRLPKQRQTYATMPHVVKRHFRDSWERCIIKNPQEHPDIPIQACLWRVNLEQIKSVKHFTAR